MKKKIFEKNYDFGVFAKEQFDALKIQQTELSAKIKKGKTFVSMALNEKHFDESKYNSVRIAILKLRGIRASNVILVEKNK